MPAHPLMIPMLGLYGQPRDHYVGEFRPAVAEHREPARLLHYRKVPGALLVSINDAGTLRLLRLETADHPELARLNDADRATLQAAVMTMHRQGGRDDAA
jgi:hypothetical protein